MMMKKNKNKQELVNGEEQNDTRGLEIVKAVAQAWYSHSEISRPMNEFDARKINFRGTPTRFKVEAMREKKKKLSFSFSSCSNRNGSPSWTTWDFGQSLWDSYELVSVSKRLETGLVLDTSFSEVVDSSERVHRKRKESNNSLRRLFSQISSSRRFNNDAKFPRGSDFLFK